MTKEAVLKYAGVSVVTDEHGKTTAHFHKSNNAKYAIWSILPEKEGGPGHRSTFYWFKLPAHTTKLGAVKILLAKKASDYDGASRADVVHAMLKEMLAKLDPELKEPKAVKKAASKKSKKHAVHVTVEKKLNDGEVAGIKASGVDKIREAAKARRAKADAEHPTAPPEEKKEQATEAAA